MMKRSNRWLRTVWLLLVLGGMSLSLLWVSAQPQMGGRGKDIKIPGYDSQNRLNSLIFAKEGMPKGDQLIEITGLRAESYSYDTGTKMTNLIVIATNCLYSQKLKVGSSDKAVEATSGDGRLKLSGIGFRFEQTNSLVIVSNKVRIEINRDIIVKKEKK